MAINLNEFKSRMLDDFVFKSLEVEFESFKVEVDKNFPSTSSRSTCWYFSEIKYDELVLSKNENRNDMTIRVKFDFHGDKWELKYAWAKVGFSPSVDLSKEKFSELIFQYFIYWKLKEIEKERESKKQSFQKMVDIIGKDVKRDHLIDQILS